MNKIIPSRLAILLIILFSLLTCMAVLFYNKSTDQIIQSGNLSLSKSDATRCPRVFQGNVEINGWQADENGEAIFKIAEQDINKMPDNDCLHFQLIDTDSKLKEQLAQSSEKNPVKINITGFAKRCSGQPLASINYTDGIFRPYL